MRLPTDLGLDAGGPLQGGDDGPGAGDEPSELGKVASSLVATSRAPFPTARVASFSLSYVRSGSSPTTTASASPCSSVVPTPDRSNSTRSDGVPITYAADTRPARWAPAAIADVTTAAGSAAKPIRSAIAPATSSGSREALLVAYTRETPAAASRSRVAAAPGTGRSEWYRTPSRSNTMVLKLPKRPPPGRLPGNVAVAVQGTAMEQTILVRVTGIDGPGITAGILRILAEAEADVLDMEQVVVRDHLNLGLLIGVREARSPLKDLLFFGWQRKLHFDFEVVEPPESLPTPTGSPSP